MSLPNLAYALSEPDILASYKVYNEDFQVQEVLNFEPDGEGDHLFLYVEKSGLTTQDVQKQLMQYFNTPAKDVSFSGMKDKQALTQQWFSVKQAEESFKLSETSLMKDLNSPQLSVKRALKNKRKLKRGSHRINQFFIQLRDLTQNPEALVERIERISSQGVPNYFGEQRFGRNQDNVAKAQQLFAGTLEKKGRYQRGIYISAARAYLFNQVLSRRVKTGTWNTYLSGDLMSLDGTSSSFKPDKWDQVLADRLDKKDIHPSGPMWGSGELQSEDLCAALEMEVVGAEEKLKTGLEQMGLDQERRSLRTMPRNLEYTIEDDSSMSIKFSLPKGAYATALLRELVKLRPLKHEAVMSAGAV